VLETTADQPPTSAKGTVKPSAIPMTMSRTVPDAVKCFSTCVVGRSVIALIGPWFFLAPDLSNCR
jgi:hypothetical protein